VTGVPPVDLFGFVPLSPAGDRAGRKRLTTLDPHDRRLALHYATSLVGIPDARSGSMVSACVFTRPGRNVSPISQPFPRAAARALGACFLGRDGNCQVVSLGGERIASWAGPGRRRERGRTGRRQRGSRGAGISR
jgi:hypothetical protein